MPTIKTKYHRYDWEPPKATIWGKGGTDDVKFYKSAYWRKIRAHQLATEPLCAFCKQKGRLISATVADHIVPRHSGGGEDQLQSLCACCHNGKR